MFWFSREPACGAPRFEPTGRCRCGGAGAPQTQTGVAQSSARALPAAQSHLTYLLWELVGASGDGLALSVPGKSLFTAPSRRAVGACPTTEQEQGQNEGQAQPHRNSVHFRGA